MTEKDMAVEIAKKLTGLQEHIDALKSALKSKYEWTPRQMAELDSVVFDLESQARLDEPSPTHSDQELQAIENATDGTPLVPLLYQLTQIMVV